MKRAFTLIELLVVIAMLAILVGALGSGMNQARKRAMIAKATQDVKEITNAILAYENFARTLTDVAGEGDTTEGNMGMILGNHTTPKGEKVPVLYNAQLKKTGGGYAICDPWGTPYRYIIRKADTINPQNKNQYRTAFYLPNFYRLSDDERRYSDHREGE